MYMTPPKAIIIVAYSAFIGYQIRKHEVDKKIGRILGHAYDDVTRRTAAVMLDEAEKRASAIPAKVQNGA